MKITDPWGRRERCRALLIIILLLAFVALLLVIDLSRAAAAPAERPAQGCGYVVVTGQVRHVSCSFLRCAGTIYDGKASYFVRSPLWTKLRNGQIVTVRVRHCW